MSYEDEMEVAPTPPDDFEARLFAGAAGINDWVTGRNERGSHPETTMRKVGGKLLALTDEFKDSAVYVQAPLVMTPFDDGTCGIGMGEVSGEIVGFIYREYPTIGDNGHEGEPQEGVVAIIATNNTNMDGSTPQAWDQVIPKKVQEKTSTDFAAKGLVPVLVPITEGAHFTQLDNYAPIHLNVSHILAAESDNTPPYDYREYVTKIENLMKGKYLLNEEADRALTSAVHMEIKAMNDRCPYLRQSVRVQADYIRTPSSRKKGAMDVISGDYEGILRKFIYGAYFPGKALPHMIPRGTVQAVVYPSETAERVFNGEITAKEADELPGTLFVPLDMEHTLEPVIQ